VLPAVPATDIGVDELVVGDIVDDNVNATTLAVVDDDNGVDDNCADVVVSVVEAVVVAVVAVVGVVGVVEGHVHTTHEQLLIGFIMQSF
jgi:hypothetical protein